MKKSVAASEKPVKAKEFDKELFKRSVEYNVRTLYRKNLEEADAQQIFQAVSYAIKDRIVENWMETQKAYEKEDPKMVYYMSMEFLMGRALGNNLINLKAYKPVAEALEELGLDLNLIEDQEPDAALGNGGLGRLAACFLDSLATLGYPAYGCGIRYRYGMFKQEIRDGYQVEVPDNWEHAQMYNLPLNEMMEVADYALNNGYTVCWDGDVSEKGFSFKNGVAINPEVKKVEDYSTTDRARFEKMDEKERLEEVYKFEKPFPEVNVTPQVRQEGFEAFVTTDDHLMHLTGIAKDQNGTKYYITKNSWGTERNTFGGYLNMSDSFVRAKTIYIMVHKDAIPKAIKSKLGI